MKRVRVLLLLSTLMSGLFANFPRAEAETVNVFGPLTGTTTWYRTNEYYLNGFVYVLEGGVLNIEAGTVIRGRQGQDADTAALVVTRGGKIFANGTPTRPIIFTAEADDVTDPDDLGAFQRGLWGGVVLLGKSVLNTTLDVAGNAASPKYEVFEGLPDRQVNGQFVNRFGGSDDDDSSGVMRYVSIRHCGVTFQPNKELNGLSLGAVGRGTVIEHIETYAVADDGYEFFGGTVNTKYLVSAFNDDDAFDVDQGYRGKNQFWFAIQEPGRKDSGGEWNGEPNGASTGAEPVANWQVYNATWIGAGQQTTGNAGLTIREYAAPRVYNSVFTDFSGQGIRVTDARSGQYVTSGLMEFADNLWFGFGTNDVSNATAAPFFTDASKNNQVVDPQLWGISREANGGLDPRPKAGSSALAGARTVPNDGFYTPVNYKGAFGADYNWMVDWTFLAAKGFLNGAGGVKPADVPGVTPPQAPMVTAAVVGGQISVQFATQAGVSYQMQAASSVDGPWADAGGAIDGTGAAGTFTESVGAGAGGRFYRVIAR